MRISSLLWLWLFTLFGQPVLAATELATFAGGCFWCMEAPFEKLGGVIDVISGFTGGAKQNPTYEEVSTLDTGHVEAVQITFDPDRVRYEKLLEVFWRQIDPTDPGGQFHDRGGSYQTAIFYHTDSQKKQAIQSKSKLEQSGRFKAPIVTKIRTASKFYPAEPSHQDYYKKNPIRYQTYRFLSGRDEFLNKVWGGK